MGNLKKIINVYTDGSCNPVYKTGGWAAILILDEKEILLEGKELNTTHNRMELISVIKALEYIENTNIEGYKIIINSDSQYVVKLVDRKEKLLANMFFTKNGNLIRNKDLVEKIFSYIDKMKIDFVKVRAHQKKSHLRNYNRDVDKISRKIVRENVKNIKVTKNEN
ncbi:RNase H family protein [Spirochaetota bacterium]